MLSNAGFLIFICSVDEGYRENMKYVIFIIIICGSPLAFSKAYWAGVLNDWSLYLDNNVVYVQSDSMASHCSYNRAQIDVAQGDYQRALYSYALSAKARGKKLSYVVDSDASTCVIFGLSER